MGALSRDELDELAAHGITYPWDLRAVLRALRRLDERRDELLGLVRAVSLEAPDAGEARELRGQVAALISEVGTLRARLVALEGRVG